MEFFFRINNAAQLVNKVENRSSKSHIDMLVGRNQSPVRLVVQGGFLGVIITTERIAQSAYSNFFLSAERSSDFRISLWIFTDSY